MATTTLRRLALTTVTTALALTLAGCPVEAPTPPTYHPEALAPGNRAFIADASASAPSDVVLTHPTTGSPSVAADPLLWGGLSGGTNPLNGDHVASVPGGGYGIVDTGGNVRLAFGAAASVRCSYSVDGSVFVLVRQSEPQGIEIYDADDLHLRRNVPWEPGQAAPDLLGVDPHGEIALVRGTNFSFDPNLRPVRAVATAGNDPMLQLVDPAGEERLSFTLTSDRRITYLVRVPGSATEAVLWTMNIDGSAPRRLGTFRGFGPEQLPRVTPELWSGRLLVQTAVADGSTSVVAVADTAAATQAIVASGLAAGASLGPWVGLA